MGFEKILGFYENFECYKGNIKSQIPPFDYVSESSMHSAITKTGYGDALTRSCYDFTASGGFAEIEVSNAERRFWVKLICCLKDWQMFGNDIAVIVNGNVISANKKEFVENINLGWAGLYFKVPEKIVIRGKNTVEIKTENLSGAGLYVSEISFVSLPEIPRFAQTSALQFAKMNMTYAVAFYDPENEFSAVEDLENCVFEGSLHFGEYTVLQFVSESAGKNGCTAVFGDVKTIALMPETVENNDFFLTGTDSDDHRHDFSDEADRIPTVFSMTAMGNLFQYKPQEGRNWIEMPNREIWTGRVNFLKSFHTYFGFCSSGETMKFIPELAGENYIGTHVHEPYLYFNFELGKRYPDFSVRYSQDIAKITATESFTEAKALYVAALENMKKVRAATMGPASVGCPSLLCVYEADAGYDRVTVEPVSNIPLLLGSVRGSGVGHWGAHIPTDWYFGSPTDLCKSRKFRLALQTFYVNGAEYAYCENAIFKTNAFERNDWESEFCVNNRKFLREFYAYTVSHPRKGKVVVDKAIIYGRNEHILWQNDDRMAELRPNDWDTKVWGKWEDTYRNAWKAARGWLPVASNQKTDDSPENRDLFSGTPFGQVDIVSAEKEWNGYKTAAFLGWNTMDHDLLEKIRSYVKSGGELFLSYCHFNTTDCNDKPMRFIESDMLQDLLGLDVLNEYKIGNTTLVNAKTFTAKPVFTDENGNVLIYQNDFGAGKLFFGAFKDYFTEPWAVDAVTSFMEDWGKNGTVFCDNKDVSFVKRVTDDGKVQYDFLNNHCALDDELDFTLTDGTVKFSGRVKSGEIYSVKL